MSEAATRAIEALNAICRRQPEANNRTMPLPVACEAVKRFHGQPHARLFRFIGCKVRTPGGPGTLLQVFADCATVILDSQLSQCSVFAPSEIEPVSTEA